MTRFLASTKIGYTKIPVSIWMEEATRMVSGRGDVKTCLFFHPNIRHMVWLGQENVFLNFSRRAWHHTRSEVERQVCDCFSDGYFKILPTRNWHQKYVCANWCLTWLVEQYSFWLNCMWILRRSYGVIGWGWRKSKRWAVSSYILEPCSTWEIVWGLQIRLQTGVGFFC